jgi:hypothetical protein
MEALLINLLIFVIVFGAIYYIVTLLPLPEPFKRIAVIVVLVIGLIVILRKLLPLAGI